jgi:glyoxylase I family protein
MQPLRKSETYITGIHHVSMETDDLEKSLRFYVDFLGLHVGLKNSGVPRRIQLVDAGGAVYLELTERKDPSEIQAPGGPYLHVAFRVSNTAALIEKVKNAGYEVTMDTRTIHSGDLHAVIGFFKGPQGELIEVFQEIDAPSETAG